MQDIIELLKTHFATIISVLGTIAGLVIVHRTGHKISLENQKATLRKTDIEAADSVRDDLMKQVEESNKRIDKKDEVIDKLSIRIAAQDVLILDLKWELKQKTFELAEQQKQITALETALEELRKQVYKPKD